MEEIERLREMKGDWVILRERGRERKRVRLREIEGERGKERERCDSS